MTGALTLAYSPCPNDTYIFAAWTEGLLPNAPPVRVTLDDVETLNEAARAGKYQLTKASYGAIPFLVDRYRILRSGGALGRGCGPLVVARGADGAAPSLDDLPDGARVAIPGELTTAFLLFRLAVRRLIVPVPMRFDRIVAAVADGDCAAGLIIHESRFTYAAAGLVCVRDLGEWWEETTGHAIPLGAILARRDLSLDETRHVSAVVRESLAYARSHEERIAPFVREHASELDENVMRAHIALYVNDYSSDLGAPGEAAVVDLFERAARAGLVPGGVQPEFV